MIFWLAAIGCDGVSVSGTVAGENVSGARDAFYDDVGIDLGLFGEYQVTVMMVTSFDDGCATFDRFLDVTEFDCDSLCEGYVAAAEEFGLDQEEYWSLSLTANTSGGVAGTYGYDSDLSEGDFLAEYRVWDARGLVDVATCESYCEDGELLDTDVTVANGGSLELGEEEEGIPAEFELQFDADELRGSYTAEPCDMDGWLLFL